MNLQKPKKYRSKKITQSAKGACCSFRIPGVCNHDNSTVVFCHAPSVGKGMRSKSDDWWGAYGCNNCHSYIDSMPVGDEAYWMNAIFETQKKLFDKGLIKLV